MTQVTTGVRAAAPLRAEDGGLRGRPVSSAPPVRGSAGDRLSCRAQSNPPGARGGERGYVHERCAVPVTASDAGRIQSALEVNATERAQAKSEHNRNGIGARCPGLWRQRGRRKSGCRARRPVPRRPYFPADAESWAPTCRRATTQIAGLPSGPVVGPIVTC